MPVAKRIPVEPARDFEILHLADRYTDPPYSKALCGKRRDRPLKPGATGEFCVVCKAMSRG